MHKTLTPHGAKMLRDAYKGTQDASPEDGAVNCDRAWIFGDARSPHGAKYLSLEKDGQPIAYIEVTNGLLKRLKGDFERWRKIAAVSDGKTY